jgi:hypothetical protein
MKWSAQFVNVALGIWLVVSAFIWPHTPAQQANTWMVGVLAAVFALVATARNQARYLDTALSVWLFASIWVLPDLSRATQWNNAVVALAIFVLSLVPDQARPIEPPATAPETATS